MHAEAEPLFKRSLAIDEKAYGPDHPDVASDLKNLAESMLSQVRNIPVILIVCKSFLEPEPRYPVSDVIIAGTNTV